MRNYLVSTFILPYFNPSWSLIIVVVSILKMHIISQRRIGQIHVKLKKINDFLCYLLNLIKTNYQHIDMQESQGVQLSERNNSLMPETKRSSTNNLIKRLLKQSVIQPNRRSNQTCCQKIMTTLDIFTFVPIPQSYPVSTKRSKIGSIILILVFLAYIIYDLVSFITNNPPRVNSYNTGIQPGQNYPVPSMAIGFIYGTSLNTTLNNASYFTISALQLNTTEGKGVQSNLTLNPCGQLNWLGDLQNFYQNLSCINPNQAKLQGVLYASNITLYPRFVVNLCDGSNLTDVKCVDNKTLYQMTSGGRIFLFIEQNQSVNLATAKSQNNNQFGQFQFFNYFMVPYIYGRVVITLQPVNYIIYPDYLTSWTTKTYLQMSVLTNEYQISNVSTYNNASMFSISVLLSSQARTVQVVYSTSIQHISLWGAFWGVLFSFFAIVFLAYNKSQFYRKRPDWQNFQDKVDELDEQKIQLTRQLDNFKTTKPNQLKSSEQI